MNRLADSLTEEIYLYGFATDVPKNVGRSAHTRLHLLLAAASLQDVAIVGPILRWTSLPGYLGVRVVDKWHVTFRWDEFVGAIEIRLVRHR